MGMKTVPLSDVQLANLTMLLTIRDSIKEDPGTACCKYGLQADELRVLSELTSDRILSIVVHMGHESLFPPRPDLGSILSLPLPLSGAMVAAKRLRRNASSPAPIPAFD